MKIKCPDCGFEEDDWDELMQCARLNCSNCGYPGDYPDDDSYWSEEDEIPLSTMLSLYGVPEIDD